MNNSHSHSTIEQYLQVKPDSTGYSYTAQADRLDTLFKNLLNFVTDGFKIHFNSVFAQVAFIASHLKLEPAVAYAFHHYRIVYLDSKNQAHTHTEEEKIQIRTGIISMLNDAIFGEKTQHLQALQKSAIASIIKPKNHTAFVGKSRMVVTKVIDDTSVFYGYEERDPGQIKQVAIDPVMQEALLKNLHSQMPHFHCPMDVMLINVRVISDVLHPELVIIMPDFLIDVTAVAECFSNQSSNPELHILRKFSPRSYSDALFIGLCANYFLDELVVNPSLSFEALIPGLFRINPMYLAGKEDVAVRQLIQSTKIHYDTILQFVSHHSQYGIDDLSNTMIEPSYSSPKYGLQGRLDLFIDNPTNRIIIELKSGSVFKPNIHGLNSSHYIQTLMYDLLVEKGIQSNKETRAHILYSKITDQPLRYAPAVRSIQLEALLARNFIMAIEYRISCITANGDDPTNVFSLLPEMTRIGFTGFTASDIKRLNLIYEGLNPLQQKYYRAYAGFIAREYIGAKSGFRRQNQTTGQSALWLNSPEEKDENYALMAHLKPGMVHITTTETIVTLEKTARTNLLADFRPGDIVVLYASDDEGQFLWQGNQLFKGTMIQNEMDVARVRLRSKQTREDLIFNSSDSWNIEKDVMDSGFNSQFKTLTAWAEAPDKTKELLMGIRPPGQASEYVALPDSDLSIDRAELLQAALSTPDYYLLWGPPGTGKTSFMIKNMIRFLGTLSDRPILVLAYTNRAVDELCETIDSLGPEYRNSYLRIGSRYGTDPVFHDRLLETNLSNISTRKALLEMLHSKKIFVGTAASLNGKPELFDLICFEWAIIDEASQILDPQILEILTSVERFIMIGDHNQLPAVVTQHPEWTRVTDPEMMHAGISDLSMSLFERLYLRAIDRGWTWAYGILHEQGRMHQDIMHFPAIQFYNGRLKTLTESQNKTDFFLPTPDRGVSGWKDRLSASRILFLPVENQVTGFQKMNGTEAELIRSVLIDLYDLYQTCGKDLSTQTIGIITPFRAQIVKINNTLTDLPFKLQLQVDTVERFQGGARDIILLSMVVTNPSQMSAIVSYNENGIDRKMNVALTRARERLIMVGDANILNQDKNYRDFIAAYNVTEGVSSL